jgi:hypothetical protein
MIHATGLARHLDNPPKSCTLVRSCSPPGDTVQNLEGLIISIHPSSNSDPECVVPTQHIFADISKY